MRPINISNEERASIAAKMLEELGKKLNEYTFGDSTSFKFEASFCEKLKDKIRIAYTPTAYLRMSSLVDEFDSEISWFGLVEKKSPKLYRVYDVLVCKQQVDGGKVDTKDEDMLDFISNLTDEQSDHMHFQAHSHVNFDTKASGTDMQNQADILASMPGHEGFYIFQIWNKRGSINTYLYDLDENCFYDKNDIELVIEDPDYEDMDLFVAEARSKVEKINYAEKYAKKKEPWKPEKKKDEKSKVDNRYLNGVPDYDMLDSDEEDLDEAGNYFSDAGYAYSYNSYGYPYGNDLPKKVYDSYGYQNGGYTY